MENDDKIEIAIARPFAKDADVNKLKKDTSMNIRQTKNHFKRIHNDISKIEDRLTVDEYNISELNDSIEKINKWIHMFVKGMLIGAAGILLLIIISIVLAIASSGLM